MPLNPPALTAGFLVPNIVSTGNIGIGVPKFSQAVAVGVCNYLTIQTKITSVGTGTLGAGATIFPLIVPQPLISTSMLQGFASVGILGPMAPLLIQGLSTGLATGWLALALLNIQYPNVGVGAGVAKFVGPSAVPAMIQGFASLGMVGEGPTKTAKAIGIGLDTIFAALVLPVPIVGSPSIVPSGGVGIGMVI